MTMIDDESMQKIGDDIEESKAKKKKVVQLKTTPVVTPAPPPPPPTVIPSYQTAQIIQIPGILTLEILSHIFRRVI